MSISMLSSADWPRKQHRHDHSIASALPTTICLTWYHSLADPETASVYGTTLMEFSTWKTFTNKKVNIILDESNFLFWKQQVLLTVRSHRLERLLTGAASPLSTTVVNEHGDLVQNELYEDFVAQDSALESWLLSTISPHLLSQFVGVETAAAVWSTVQQFFANRSTTAVISLHYKLQSLKKGSDSMRTYLTRIKEVCDALDSCESAIPQAEHITSILKCLPHEYQPYIVFITTMKDALSLDKICSMLIDAETQLAGFDSQEDSLLMSAHIVQAGLKTAGHSYHDRGSGRSGSNNSGRGGGRGRGRPRVQYRAVARGESGPANYSGFETVFAVEDECMCCTKARSETQVCHSSQPQPRTTINTRDHWVVDSGATHHVTPDSAKVLNHKDLSGPSLMLNDLLLVPKITKNLLSVSKLARDNGVYFEFHASNCCVRDEGTGAVLLQGKEKDGLYLFHIDSLNNTSASFEANSVTASHNLYELWHRRLGHPAHDTLGKICKLLDVNVERSINETCVACHMGKGHKLPFSDSATVYDLPFQLVFTDLWGPSPIVSNGYKYYVSFVDARTRHTWLYLLKDKSQAAYAFQLFQQLVKTQFGLQIVSVQSDWGGEYLPLSRILAEAGISHRITCPHTSEQNVVMAVHLINRLPSRVLNGQSPFECMFNKKLDYGLLRVFGCRCFPHLRPFNVHKLDFRSQPCTFLGVSSQHKGFLCLTPDKCVVISCHVRFDEWHFPFATNQPIVQPSLGLPLSRSLDVVIDTKKLYTGDALVPSISQSPIGNTGHSTTHSVSDNESTVMTEFPSASQEDPATRSKCGVFKPKVYITFFDYVVPTTIEEAFQSAAWTEAVHAEYSALLDNETWVLVPLPADRNLVGCKWLFKLKRNPDGSVLRYKARLVAKGFTQVPGLDFQNTFSPVVKFSTVYVLLTMVVAQGWVLRHVDINNAFLNGDLHEDVYMQQPPEFVQCTSDGTPLVCKLKKALYGLRQAPHNWNDKLKASMLDFGFVESKANVSLFVRIQGDCYTYALVYVDDILITGTSTETVNQVVRMLSSRFSLKDIAFAVNKAVQYMQSPREIHLVAVKRILRYLAVSLDHGLVFSDSDARLCLKSFSDADWAGDASDRRSMSGYCVFLGGCLVAWNSKKQKTVSRSTMEAEYMSVADSAAEITWLAALLCDLGLSLRDVPVIWCDNTSIVALSINPVCHARSKHVELDVHFIREKIAAGTLRVSYVPAAFQVADGLTKLLTRPAFEQFREKLRVFAHCNMLNNPPPGTSNPTPTGNLPYFPPQPPYGDSLYGQPPPDPILPYFPYYYRKPPHQTDDQSPATKIGVGKPCMTMMIATAYLLAFIYFF
ncbi:hypothetical protein F3Y22_tig00110893pilonHSYRG00648 [Hibiscus syriacus]|uniref:Integrase catalytic domain-containing protein n=1 Tax=Hibiscus syriacus TaxID=106335 RepID=A0A6A2ZIT9_HIBSY|nr:hypothetical protein F3Y22_tig00110893pilonHSYRG00648 [Hibiscus syriacus]